MAAATSALTRANEHLEERVRERTAQLQTSNEALRRFGDALAHDLKGPVSATLGFSELLTRTDLGEDLRRRLAERAVKASRSIATMIDGMLADAVNAGATDAEATLTGDEFAAWVREVSGPELDAIGGRLEVEVDDGLVVGQVADVLRRSTLNLVTNAAKYAVNADGTVVRVRLSATDLDLVLRVEDNGPGIPPLMWDAVFEPGTRLVADDRGFGLGLAAVRELAQRAGGSVSGGRSDDLGGAAFTVILPVALPSGARPDRTLSARPGPSRP